VQKLKLDTESAMLELDQILRANEVTVALVAAVPSLLIAGGSGYALLRWLTPSPPDRRREALPARRACSSRCCPTSNSSPCASDRRHAMMCI
jgi:nuclear-control-of-ATPase protein 2